MRTTQCGNFRHFLPLRFYVKWISDILEVHKTAIDHLFRGSECWFWWIFAFLKAQCDPNQNSEPQKRQKRLFLGLKWPKMISRKIWMGEISISWYFHTVDYLHFKPSTVLSNTEFFCHSDFYVKSMLENLEVMKTAVFAILESLNFVTMVTFSPLKVPKCLEIKFQSLPIC